MYCSTRNMNPDAWILKSLLFRQANVMRHWGSLLQTQFVMDLWTSYLFMELGRCSTRYLNITAAEWNVRSGFEELISCAMRQWLQIVAILVLTPAFVCQLFSFLISIRCLADFRCRNETIILFFLREFQWGSAEYEEWMWANRMNKKNGVALWNWAHVVLSITRARTHHSKSK